MKFDELTEYFERLELTRSRIEMYRVLGRLFNSVAAAETSAIAYLCEARLARPFESVEIAMGEHMVVSAIAGVTNGSELQVIRLYKQIGDLGETVEKLLPGRRRSNLTVGSVHSRLRDIARTRGKGSVARKVALLAALIERSSPREARYIVRFTLGRLRLGVGTNTIIEAVARTCEDPASARIAIERAYNLCSDLGTVLTTVREAGMEGLRGFKVRIGNPVRMMMAERLRSAEAIIARLGRCSAESKLDGVRCQAHLCRGHVEIFSRNLEPTSSMFPDLV
jgi:DNA ligase-1